MPTAKRSVPSSSLDPLEGSLDVLHGIAQHHWSAVWTGDWEFGFRQFGEEPLHFVMVQGHVHFDRGVAGDGGGDAGAERVEVEFLIFAGELFEKLVQHAFDFGSVDACRRGFNRNAAGTERFSFESVAG